MAWSGSPPVAPDDISTVCRRAYRILTRLRERGRGGGETEAEIDKGWREKREEGRMPIYPVGPEATPSLPPSFHLDWWAHRQHRGGGGKREEKDLETPNQGGRTNRPLTHTLRRRDGAYPYKKRRRGRGSNTWMESPIWLAHTSQPDKDSSKSQI